MVIQITVSNKWEIMDVQDYPLGYMLLIQGKEEMFHQDVYHKQHHFPTIWMIQRDVFLKYLDYLPQNGVF